MPVDEAPEDDVTRHTYNFAPGSYGLVYRADVPDHGAGQHLWQDEKDDRGEKQHEITDKVQANETVTSDQPVDQPHYKLQAMKWGLVPFWTKRNPDYGTLMRTINCRDDSLSTNGGLWNTMKHKKRCMVVCQGFYEWLKKSGGKEKVPHFVKRKDGQLMCFAGLWDCAKFEDSEDKLYTYTVITTDSNKQLKFLHDRMPVIFDNGSDDMFTWLDSNRTEWNKELQSLLKPYDGELECYPVSKEVGKVGNNSPSFIIPIDSSENKQNISNFFANQKKLAKGQEAQKAIAKEEDMVKEGTPAVKKEADENRETVTAADDENNAPMPKPAAGVKREYEDSDGADETSAEKKPHISSPPPSRTNTTSAARKTRSATTNSPKSHTNSPAKGVDGSQRITNFFNK